VAVLELGDDPVVLAVTVIASFQIDPGVSWRKHEAMSSRSRSVILKTLSLM
jgi:hypothetical protein